MGTNVYLNAFRMQSHVLLTNSNRQENNTNYKYDGIWPLFVSHNLHSLIIHFMAHI